MQLVALALGSLLFLPAAANAFLIPAAGTTAKVGSIATATSTTTTTSIASLAPALPKTAMASAAAPVTTSFVGSKLVRVGCPFGRVGEIRKALKRLINMYTPFQLRPQNDMDLAHEALAKFFPADQLDGLELKQTSGARAMGGRRVGWDVSHVAGRIGSLHSCSNHGRWCQQHRDVCHVDQRKEIRGTLEDEALMVKSIVWVILVYGWPRVTLVSALNSDGWSCQMTPI